jgi:hypothetical protein
VGCPVYALRRVRVLKGLGICGGALSFCFLVLAFELLRVSYLVGTT